MIRVTRRGKEQNLNKTFSHLSNPSSKNISKLKSLHNQNRLKWINPPSFQWKKAIEQFFRRFCTWSFFWSHLSFFDSAAICFIFYSKMKYIPLNPLKINWNHSCFSFFLPYESILFNQPSSKKYSTFALKIHISIVSDTLSLSSQSSFSFFLHSTSSLSVFILYLELSDIYQITFAI